MDEASEAVREMCEECGFDAADWSDSTAAAAFADLAGEWRTVLAGLGDETCHRRPAPAVWSPIEYTVHTARVVSWWYDAVQTTVAGGTLTIIEADYPDADRHPYNDVPVEEALAELDAAARRLASWFAGLAPEQAQAPLRLHNPGLEALYHRSGIGDARAGGIHALNDALHHLADIQR